MWLILLILEQSQMWSYVCSVEIGPNAGRELALQRAGSSGCALYVEEWKAMFTRFFIFFKNPTHIYPQKLFLLSSLRTFSWACSSPGGGQTAHSWVLRKFPGCKHRIVPLVIQRDVSHIPISEQGVCVTNPNAFLSQNGNQPTKGEARSVP